jgi:hypothetical protein
MIQQARTESLNGTIMEKGFLSEDVFKKKIDFENGKKFTSSIQLRGFYTLDLGH